MGKEKAGFLTPKAISNRIKAKGLQKLRWYCQMCQKQCRDENGFKCHLTSESHQRQLLLFAENPDKYLDTFSQEFLDEFLELLSRRYGTKRVHVNMVYQEYISDRHHVHMNSTQWETLTEFAKWLGREGHCTADQTEKGWFIQWIDRSPEMLRRQMENEKKEKMELDDEERTARFIQKQIERANTAGSEKQQVEFTELKRESEEEKVAFSLSATKPKEEPSTSKPPAVNPLQTTSMPPPKKAAPKSGSNGDGPEKKKATLAGQKRKSALDEIMEMEEQKKEKMNRKDYWLHPGIVVKVVTKKLGEKYYKKKAYVMDVQDKYMGLIKVLDTGDKLKVDQAHVETVIPAIGKPVRVVNGAHRGEEAVLLGLDEKSFSCSVRLDSGSQRGKTVSGVKYEDISKLYIAS